MLNIYTYLIAFSDSSENEDYEDMTVEITESSERFAYMEAEEIAINKLVELGKTWEILSIDILYIEKGESAKSRYDWYGYEYETDLYN